MLESTREEVDRISATVDDLLVLARADEVGLAAVHERVDLRELAAAAAAPFGTLARARGVTLRFEGTPAPALGDPESLRHALHNLVDNAVKFTPGGGAVRRAQRTLQRRGGGRRHRRGARHPGGPA